MGYPDMMRDILAQARRKNTAERRKALESRSIIDAATGLYSREYFHLRLDEEMARSRSYGNRLSLMLIDAGPAPAAGPVAQGRIEESRMRILSGIIRDCMKEAMELAFAYDGCKFAVIMPEATLQEASMTAEHIRQRILREQLPGVAPRAGVVQYREHEDIDELIREADEALRGHAGS